MIVLSVGMPRAGSGWHYNFIHDLMKAAGATDAHEIREKYHLQKILTEVNCNIGVLSARRLGMVAIPSLLGKTYTIKAHSAPTQSSRLFTTLGLMRITYIYRDPRDAMLSAYEFGQRALTKGRPNAFSHLSTFEKSVDFMMQYVLIWEKWMKEKNVLVARYEDLLTNFSGESARLVNHLKLDMKRPEIQSVMENYSPDVSEGQQGHHFYKGKIGRFRDFYNDEQKSVLLARLTDYLPGMGYDA